jgi:oxygen-independent coproporphyrinogen-3 oxidase
LKDAEVTLECEPGTKKLADFDQLRHTGFNRISIGLQSLQDHHLKNLNRSHNSAQAIQMVEDVHQAGLDNVHVDLMYALPGQTLDEWSATLDGAVGLGVSHISAYHLIVFQHELLDRKIVGNVANSIPETSVINEMRQVLAERLEKAGFVRYSLTEFGKPGCQCEYVKSNWNGSDYLGFGPGAYSRNGRWLWENDVLHVRYEEKVASNQLPIGRCHLMGDRTALIRDATMGLCLLELNLDAIQERHSASYSNSFWELIDELVDSGFLFREAEIVKLTSSGIRHATHVMKRITDLDLV